MPNRCRNVECPNYDSGWESNCFLKTCLSIIECEDAIIEYEEEEEDEI